MSKSYIVQRFEFLSKVLFSFFNSKITNGSYLVIVMLKKYFKLQQINADLKT